MTADERIEKLLNRFGETLHGIDSNDLAAVINKLETALDTAVRVTDCWTCQNKRADKRADPLKCYDCTGAKQYYKIRDFMLHDQKETDNEQS